MRHSFLKLGFLVSFFSASPVSADSNLLFILDSSNSMWGQISGVAKIDTAKTVLNQALIDLPENVLSGLMAYGHRRRGDCSDVELLAPIGESKDSIRSLIKNLSPVGKTPIAATLLAAFSAFEGKEEDNNNILLISDGIETCDGDPCAVAAELIKRGINLRVNVVGFDVDSATRTQLQCIADRGNGEYFDARDPNDFSEAIQKAQEIAIAPEPEPEPEPVIVEPAVYFEDNFDGNDLASVWTLSNPNPDNYLVENGVLSLVTNDGTPSTLNTGQNILRLDKPIPRGDWTMTVRMVIVPQTMGEIMRIGLSRDAKTSLYSSLQLASYNYALTQVFLRSDKLAQGESTGFSRVLFEIRDRTVELRSTAFTDQIAAVQLRLERKGRNYTSSLRFEATNPGDDGAVSEEWFTVQQLTSLRTPGDAFTLIFGTTSNDYTPANGEGAIEIDWVKIEVPR